jgi:serine carboxypeptidase 1
MRCLLLLLLLSSIRWDDLNSFLSSPRTPIYCDKEGQSGTQAFVKSYKNLNFYWILEAGHMVINEW